MADSAESRLLLRLQATGDNVNTWGGYVNDNFSIIGRAAKGYEAIALTGDQTISWTNYSTTNVMEAHKIKFTGTLSSAATVTVPAREHSWRVWNAAGNAVTVTTAAGSGVTLQDGDRAILSCDGTDVINDAPTIFPSQDITISGQIDGLTAGTATGDAVEYDQMNAAIAAGGGTGAADGTVKMDALASSLYLNAAILVSGDTTKTDNGDTMTLSTPVKRLSLAMSMALGA